MYQAVKSRKFKITYVKRIILIAKLPAKCTKLIVATYFLRTPGTFTPISSALQVHVNSMLAT